MILIPWMFADTMMKFASFENIVELLYKHVVPTPKEQCSSSMQLGVSFAGGYLAGILCAIVSHPADNLVSFLNNAKGASVGDVSIHSDLFRRIIYTIHRLILNLYIIGCYIQAIQKMGVLGLCTRGLPLRILMIGTLTGAQWGIYDSFKVYVGL